MTPPEVRHGGGIAFQPCCSSIATAIQHGLDHRRSNAEIAGMQGSEHVSGRSDQAPLASQADYGGGAGHAEAKLLGHRPPGTFINQQKHRLAAA